MDLPEHGGPWLLPGEPLPVRLMNTIWADRTSVHDALGGPDDLRAWLVATGLLPGAADAERAGPEVVPDDVELARSIRDALRRLTATVTDDERTRAATHLDQADATRTLNAALAALPPATLSRTGTTWALARPAPQTVRSVLAQVAEAGVRLAVDPGRPLRACPAPGCVLYFVQDHPRREWCSIGCGNRVRSARRYARRRVTGG